MRIVFAVAVFISALPFLASAQAGFPDRPLWLSNTKPVAGEEVSISTVLYNASDATTAGTLLFLVDGEKLSSQDVSLAPQSSTVVSAKWTARSGSHSFSARFSSGESATVQQQTSAVEVAVAEPPPPSALQQNVERATAVASTFASSSAPIVQQVAQTVFAQTEALRNAGIEYLEKKVDAPATAKNASDSKPAATGFAAPTSTQSSGSTLHNVGQAALAASLFTLRSLYLFYPLLAFLLFFGLYWAIKKLRRPRA